MIRYCIAIVGWIGTNMKPTLGRPPAKKMFSFGHCLKRGGEAPARILWPFFYHVLVPKIGIFLPKTLNICKFGNFLLSLSSKLPSLLSLDRHYHNWHFFCHTRKTSFLTFEKKRYKLPKMGGGELIRAMHERKHFFLHEVFPYQYCCNSQHGHC